MLTKTKMSGLLVIGMAVTGCMVFGCSKNEKGAVNTTDQEQVLFEDKRDANGQTAREVFLGGNVKKVTAIRSDHSVVEKIKSSAEWKAATAGVELDLSAIRRTYVHSTDASLVTIPVVSKTKTSEYFNVYLGQDRILLTRFSEIRQAGGMTTCKIESPAGELYYQFDLNNRNQLGNWKFEKDLPKLYDTDRDLSLVGRDPEDCSKKKFNSCMSCVIVDVCGSDWICSIACGLAIPSCVGGAALYCLII
ncbi:hypothetical protein LZZ85_21180 [Terrimonas sp. NA20]|uniref:Lipoprotein n=1 Tax=Terrimonas ginsenosidimutans TaxID=2908004 RepID=A0ABS9KWY3_9BACT|nr:hypothetical protein [Terrimonas ginsenosidimutans]MCG2616823.1 hypothetical protein [Terrimonas ginsenosidimutans]